MTENATEHASIPEVTTLTASDEYQRAVAVRFSYPSPAVSGSCPLPRSFEDIALRLSRSTPESEDEIERQLRAALRHLQRVK